MPSASSAANEPVSNPNASAVERAGSASASSPQPSSATEKDRFAPKQLVRFRDSDRGGTVQRVRENSVAIVDRRTKTNWLAHPRQLRPMEPEEVEQYHSRPFAGDPHPQVTLRRKLEIIATWSDDVPMQRVNGRIG